MPLSKTNTYILSEHYTACLHGNENDKIFKTHFQKFADSGTLITVFTYTKGKRNDNLAFFCCCYGNGPLVSGNVFGLEFCKKGK